MKYLLLPLLFIVFNTAFSQEPGINISENGLIYSRETISQLKHIVDSLNLKFRVCEPDPQYSAKLQATGHHIRISGSQCKAARADLQAGITVDALLKKYRDAELTLVSPPEL